MKTPFLGWLEMPEIHLNGCWWWGLFHCLTPMTPMSAKINLDTSPSHSCSTRISRIAFQRPWVGEISTYHTVPRCFCLRKKLITARCQNLHSQKLTWTLKISIVGTKVIFQTIMFRVDTYLEKHALHTKRDDKIYGQQKSAFRQHLP